MFTKFNVVGFTILAVLFTIWPIPDTFSIRDSLLLLGCITFTVLARRAHRQTPVSLGPTLYPTVLLASLTLWMFIVAVWISNETAWSLNEIRGQWLKALVAYALGLLVALSLARDARLSKYAVFGIAAILLLHILYIDITGIHAWVQGIFTFRAVGLTGGPDKGSYLTNILFALLLADALLRWQRRGRLLSVPGAVLYVAIAATVISVIAERTRNGMLALTAMLVIAAFLMLRHASSTRKVSVSSTPALIAVLIAGMSLLFLAASFKPGVGAHVVLDTLPVALDTTTNKAWLNSQRYPLPVLPNGAPVDESAYLRIAWFKEAIKMLFEDPLGRGFGRNAFGHGLMEKYGEGKGHSHSGLLDFAIGVGVPGTVLWLGFLVSLVAIARRELDGERAGYAVALLLLVVDFGARMVVDGIIRDHMLQMFLFLVALFAGLTVYRKPGQTGTVATV